MLLAVDAGNTDITIGVFKGRRLAGHWRLPTEPGRGAGFYRARLSEMVSGAGVGANALTSAVLGSVVPSLTPVLESVCRKVCGRDPLVVTSTTSLGVRCRVRNPSEVGVDRILNILAASRLFSVKRPGVVIDFGTATTFDCISSQGDYLGGSILIGPRLAAKALSDHTALLPYVEVRRPRRVIGKDTVECIQSGLFHGYLGMIESVLRATLQEMNHHVRGRSGNRVRIIATGGLAKLFAPFLPRVERVVPELTLHGLRLAYEHLSMTGRASN